MDAVDIAAVVFVVVMVIGLWLAVYTFINQDARNPSWYKTVQEKKNANVERPEDGDTTSA